MQITTKEISLEELNNNVVEYVLKSPHNTNPAILRQMLNSRGISAPATSAKSTIIFEISGDTDSGDVIHEDDYRYLANVVTGEIVTPEELAKITLSGTGFVAQIASEGIQIGEDRYALSQILGFMISGGGIGIACVDPSWTGMVAIYLTDVDYKQAYLDALMQEIS